MGHGVTEERAETGPSRLVLRLLVGLILAVVVFSGVALFGDVRLLRAALEDFAWWLLIPALVLTLWNYFVRFLKWQLYLRQLGVTGLSSGNSMLVFLSAFAMSITPGKVGELIKCGFLRRLTGVPISRSSAIVVAERLTDGLAMLVLASVGATQFAAGRAILAATAIAALAAILLLSRPQRLRSVIERLPSLPVVGSVSGHAHSFVDASGSLVRPRLLLIGTALGVVAWLGECVAFFLILIGLDLPATWQLLLIATFVLAVSSLAGALSMLPGGLGVAEASVAGMLLLLVTDDAMDRGVAAAATLLIRFATLWFAVILGVAALALLRRRIGRMERPVAAPEAGPVEAGTGDPAMRRGGGYR